MKVVVMGAGVIGVTSPWAAPGIPVKAVKWMFMKRRPLFIWPLISPTMWKCAHRWSSTATKTATAPTRAAWCGCPAIRAM